MNKIDDMQQSKKICSDEKENDELGMLHVLPPEMLSDIIKFLPVDKLLWNVAFVSYTLLELMLFELKKRIPPCPLDGLMPSVTWIHKAFLSITTFDSLSPTQQNILYSMQRRKHCVQRSYIKDIKKNKLVLPKLKYIRGIKIQSLQGWNCFVMLVNKYCNSIRSLNVHVDESIVNIDELFKDGFNNIKSNCPKLVCLQATLQSYSFIATETTTFLLAHNQNR